MNSEPLGFKPRVVQFCTLSPLPISNRAVRRLLLKLHENTYTARLRRLLVIARSRLFVSQQQTGCWTS
jgi:hypothetical protein